jgi:hypothetical protein
VNVPFHTYNFAIGSELSFGPHAPLYSLFELRTACRTLVPRCAFWYVSVFFFCYTENLERPACKILIRRGLNLSSIFAAFLSKNNDESCSQPLNGQRLMMGAYSGAPK